ncbi:MAG: ABC transporter permease [Candidatus Heimdallarchaeota archaeon]
MKRSSQFGAILKKDLRLVFTVKTLLVTVLVPFLMMFLIIGVPSIFIGTTNVTIALCNQDTDYTGLDAHGTNITVNIGDLIVYNLTNTNIQGLTINIVDTRSEALNASNGIFIPVNFTRSILNGTSSFFEYRKSGSSQSLQGAYFDQAMNIVQQMIVGVFLVFYLESDLPDLDIIEYIPPSVDPDGIWSQETLALAGPFSYALFIMVSLIGNMGRTIGFSKEKEDGTFETMLSITKNRSHLVFSKLIVGMIASTLSIISYFAGSALATLIAQAVSGDAGQAAVGIEGFLSFPAADLFSFKGVLLLIGLGIALLLTMLALMTVDTVFSKAVAERVGTFVIIGFGFMFYFAVIFDPATTAIYAQVNPLYWIYHSFMSMIDLSFTWLDGLFIGLTVALLGGLIFLATKAIEREKVLFT